MHLFVQFPDFSKTAAIDSYIEKRLRSIHRRLEANRNATVTLRGVVLGKKMTVLQKNSRLKFLSKYQTVVLTLLRNKT